MYRKDFIDKAGSQDPERRQLDLAEYLETIKKMNGQKLRRQRRCSARSLPGSSPRPSSICSPSSQASMGGRWFKQLPRSSLGFRADHRQPREHRRHQALRRASTRTRRRRRSTTTGSMPACASPRAISACSTGGPPTSISAARTATCPARIRSSPTRSGSCRCRIPTHPQVGSTGGWSLGITANSAAAGRGLDLRQMGDLGQGAEGDGALRQVRPSVRRLRPALALRRTPSCSRYIPICPGSCAASRPATARSAAPGVPTYTTLESIYGLNLNKVLTGEHVAGDMRQGDRHAVDQRAQGQFHDPLFAARAMTTRWTTAKKLIASLAG